LAQHLIALLVRHAPRRADKFCVAQTDDATIAVALECLPLWIAGCQQLVVLLGPQFLSRTWCLMELFTHLEMGGSSERITLLLVGNGPSAAARSVDVAASQCDRASDLEMMLAVIEASAGGSRAFNAQLELLLARLDVPVPLYAARGRARSRSSAARAATARASSFILITDPGPDPDDVRRTAASRGITIAPAAPQRDLPAGVRGRCAPRAVSRASALRV
jgi:hypothetical protein